MTDQRSGVTIRGRRAEDWAALYALCESQPSHLNPLEVPYRSEDTARTTFGAIPDNVNTFSLIAEEKGTLLGEITLRHVNRERRRHIGIIEHLVLIHDARATIGTPLLAAALDLGINWLHLSRIETIVAIDHTALIALYTAASFTIEGTLREYAYRQGSYVDAHMLAHISQNTGR